LQLAFVSNIRKSSSTRFGMAESGGVRLLLLAIPGRMLPIKNYLKENIQLGIVESYPSYPIDLLEMVQREEFTPFACAQVVKLFRLLPNQKKCAWTE
jgi:hypothetical protein